MEVGCQMVNFIKRNTLTGEIAVLKEWIEELEHGTGSYRKLTPTGKLAIADLKSQLRAKQEWLRRSHQATMPKKSLSEQPARFFLD